MKCDTPLLVCKEYLNPSHVESEVLKTMDMAIMHFQNVVNNPELRNFILNFRNNVTNETRFLQTEKSNSWHLTRFIEAPMEHYSEHADIDLKIKFKKNVMHINTNLGSLTVDYNTKHLFRSIPSIVSILVHEYCHLVGMEHSFRNPSWTIWTQTAPYAIGYKAGEITATKMGLGLNQTFYLDNAPTVGQRIERWLRKVLP